MIIDPIIFGRPTTTARRQAWFLENVRALRELVPGPGLRTSSSARAYPTRCSPTAREHRVTHAHFIRNHTPYAAEPDAAAEARPA